MLGTDQLMAVCSIRSQDHHHTRAPERQRRELREAPYEGWKYPDLARVNLVSDGAEFGQNLSGNLDEIIVRSDTNVINESEDDLYTEC